MMGLEGLVLPPQMARDPWAIESEFDLTAQLRWIERNFGEQGILISDDNIAEVLSALASFPTASSTENLFVIETEANAPRSDRILLFEFKRLSGLTWDQIAQLCCVSRRAVHHWASGAKISNQNKEKLGQLLATIRFIDRGYADENRDLLLASSFDDGRTTLEMLEAGEFDAVRARIGKGNGRPLNFEVDSGPGLNVDQKPIGELLANLAEGSGSDEVILDENVPRRRANIRRK